MFHFISKPIKILVLTGSRGGLIYPMHNGYFKILFIGSFYTPCFTISGKTFYLGGKALTATVDELFKSETADETKTK